MKLLTAIQRFFIEPDTDEVQSLRAALKERTKLHAEQLEESDEIWRAQMTELINQHCVERSAWAREKRELIELEQRARTAMDNAQALMNPVPASLVALTTPTEPKLCSAEVSSGQRREVRQAAVLGLQVRKDD